jgi:hypothetical protein
MFNFNLIVLSLLIFYGLGIYPQTVLAQCSADDIRSYMEGGATPEQMSQLCGQQGNNGGYSPYVYPGTPIASVCATQWGMCPLVQQLPVGSACACYTQAGQIPGIAR